MESFGAYLRSRRESRGMTVNQLGMYSEISAATISRIENGKRGVPKPATIKKISTALKVPYKEMMEKAGFTEEIEIEGTLEEIEVDRKRKLGLEYIARIKDDKTLDLAIELLEKLSKE
jgi:transcriptional regulator with XRE-family HTH domain